MSNQQLQTQYGTFKLQRWPLRQQETLQAWDAADEYLLARCADFNLTESTSRLAIFNDHFGALSTCLHQHRPIMVSDSYIARVALNHNLAINAIHPAQVTFIDSLALAELPRVDVVLLRIPKNLAYLEYQLQCLRPHLHVGSRIVAAAMVKHLTYSVTEHLQQYIGRVQASLAVKKARLLNVEFDPQLSPVAPSALRGYQVAATGLGFEAYANVFARDKLDIGSRFFLEHIASMDSFDRVADLGCGNGVIGIHYAQRHPAADLLFVDESYMAVASTERNFRAAFAQARAADFQVADGLSDYQGPALDCVLLNPPFHQQHAVGDQTAQRMFRQAHLHLRCGGQLHVIGNRHLNYHQSLKTVFGNSQVVANNPKFVILKAVKRS